MDVPDRPFPFKPLTNKQKSWLVRYSGSTKPNVLAPDPDMEAKVRAVATLMGGKAMVMGDCVVIEAPNGMFFNPLPIDSIFDFRMACRSWPEALAALSRLKKRVKF